MLISGWQFTPEGTADIVTLITGTNLTGIEMVTVSDGLRTMLTFSGVRREADGGTVVCVVIGSVPTVTDRATLTVWCEYQSSANTKGPEHERWLPHVPLTWTPQSGFSLVPRPLGPWHI